MVSVGTTLLPAEPPVWYDDTSTSVSVTLRYSCWSLPALRQTSTAFLKCSPLAQPSISLGEALFTFILKLKSRMLTLPAPPPPPAECAPVWASPQLHVSTSISPLCLWSDDSPSTPSIFRK